MTMTVFGGQVNENRMADGVMKHAMIRGNLVDSSLIRVEPFCFNLPVSLKSDLIMFCYLTVLLVALLVYRCSM